MINNNSNSNLPNVIYAGVQRTGSTWLYDCFNEHPQVYVPFRKEIHYFDRNYEKGQGWYEAFFQAAEDEPVKIDITPNYFHDPSIPGRIFDLLPDCKILIVLRNPVNFIFSLYNKHRQSLFVQEEFSDLLENKDYLYQAVFSTKLNLYLKTFRQAQVFIGYYEDFANNNKTYLSKIYQYLDISYHQPTISDKIINPPVEPRYQGLHSLFMHLKNISSKNKILHKITTYLRPYILHNKWYSQPLNQIASLTEEQKKYLEDYFTADVLALSDMLDINLLSYWGFSKTSS